MMDESGRTPMNGREMRILEYMAVLDDQFAKAGDCMKERLKLVPNGWRQWRLMVTVARNLLVRLYGTVSTKNLRHIQHLCQYGEVLLRVKSVARDREYTLVADDDLAVILNAAIAAECEFCMRDEMEARKCPMARALMNIAPPYDVPAHRCGYQAVTEKAKMGDYV